MRFLKEIKKLFKGNLGYTLLEVAAVVAVTGTLAAVAMPVVKDKLGQSKEVAALENMRNLSGAISQYYGDTSKWPRKGSFYTVGLAGSLVTTDIPAAAVLRTEDVEDAVVTAKSVGTRTDWFAVTVAASSVITRNNGSVASWNGPYSSQSELEDPWGHPFYVAIEDGIPALGAEGTTHSTTDPNHSTAIFVLSAGENETIETPRQQCMQAFAKVGDDIVLRIR